MRTSRNIGLTCDVFRSDVRGLDFGIGQRRNLDWPAEIRRCCDFKRKFEIRATPAASGLTRKELVDRSISPEMMAAFRNQPSMSWVRAYGDDGELLWFSMSRGLLPRDLVGRFEFFPVIKKELARSQCKYLSASVRSVRFLQGMKLSWYTTSVLIEDRCDFWGESIETSGWRMLTSRMVQLVMNHWAMQLGQEFSSMAEAKCGGGGSAPGMPGGQAFIRKIAYGNIRNCIAEKCLVSLPGIICWLRKRLRQRAVHNITSGGGVAKFVASCSGPH